MTLRFNDGGFTIVEKLSKALREILQHWRLSLASLLFYILLSLLANLSRERLLVLARNMSMPQCPSPSVFSNNCMQQNQCFTLESKTDAENICDLAVSCRNQTNVSLEFNLNHCPWRTSKNLGQLGNTSSDCLSVSTKENCTECLMKLVLLDQQVETNYTSYSSILKRYDCDKSYSIWGCDDCKAVYKDWLCGLSFDFYDEDGLLAKPCLKFCYQTSSKCPFLLPAVPYCGTQSYFCPKESDLLENSTYTTPPCYSYTLGKPQVFHRPHPTSSAAILSITKASLTSLLIGQLASLWIARTLFDIPVGFA